MTVLRTIAGGADSRISDRRRVIVRTPEEWTALWAAHAGPEAEPPPVDFSSQFVAAAFAGQRPTAGHAIEIAGAIEEDGGTRLVVEERRPARGTVTAQVLTSPFHIVSLPRVAGDVRWMEPSTGRSHGARPGFSSRTPTLTGLRPRTAGMLAYLAGPFSGAIMLLAEPAHPFVRFHAWQSILALGALMLAMLTCYVLAFAALFFSANGIVLMVRAAMVVAVALVALWAVCLWKTWSAGSWKLPLAGDWAERLVARGSRSK
jgi:uncharacterized membrane protein